MLPGLNQDIYPLRNLIPVFPFIHLPSEFFPFFAVVFIDVLTAGFIVKFSMPAGSTKHLMDFDCKKPLTIRKILIIIYS